MYRFFEVFKTLKLPEDLAVYFENVEVTKVSKTSTNSLARVYIKSDRVIEKPIIFKVEDALKKQIFRISNMDVRIIDRYVLSAQYTPQTVMDIYYDSILAELEKYWTLEYNLLKNSQWEFEKEDMLVFTIEDSFLAHQYADTLTDYFKKIFLNRFGFEIDVEYQYAKKKESQYERENAYRINLRVKEIENNMMATAGMIRNLLLNRRQQRKLRQQPSRRRLEQHFLQAITEAGKSLRHTAESLLTKMFYMEEILTVM